MIPVTQPLLPPLEEFNEYLREIWDRKWLTNNGHFHQELEKALCAYLGVEHLSLFSNGTLALITALQALRITGEVITTPYSFVATTHALWWNNIKPVFVDIEPHFMNLDPKKIEAAITPKTTAILPVHVYGNPCEVEGIQKIADTYGLKVIYDAAHAFGTRIGGVPILDFGDLSVLSFHATKVFNTLEGGAIVCHDAETKRRIDKLKNFGYENEVSVVAPGINAKMNEIQAAFGLLQLRYIDDAICRRRNIHDRYTAILRDVPGVRLPEGFRQATTPYSYFPVFIDETTFGSSRDDLYSRLKGNGILTRRYFYPLISEFPTYSGLESSRPDNLSMATRISREVLCLPIFPDLALEAVDEICEMIKLAR